MTVPEYKGDMNIVAEVIEKQKDYEESRATLLGRGAERLTAPLGGTVARLIPSDLVLRGLEAADHLAGATLPSEVSTHDLNDLAACEAAALTVQGWAAGANAATGGAAGWFGAAGMAADIPATIALAARNVRATGNAFGFVDETEHERAFRLMVLQVATAQAGDGRREMIESVKDMAKLLNSPEGRMVLEKGGEWVTEKIVERIARQLGVNLAGRKAGQIVPVVGGAVAAVVNASFQSDVSRAARYAFRLRWLTRRQLLPAAERST